jgi:hypothetical protein
MAGVGSAAAAGVCFLVMAIVEQAGENADPSPSRRMTAAAAFDSANREAELYRTKQELAAAHARLAVREASPGKTALASRASPPDLSGPPPAGLVLWFDAAKGTRADAAGAPASMNGPVGQWHDISSIGGKAVLQYTASTTKNKEDHYPTLRLARAGGGLSSALPVIAFDGAGDTLCLRDRDKTGDPIGKSLDDGKTTVLILFRITGSNAPEGLLVARGDKRRTMWSLGIRDHGLVAGPGSTTPLRIAGTESEFRIASVVVDAAAGNLHLGLISSDGQKVSADARVTVDPAARFDMLRMGTSDGNSNSNRSVFAGEVAEILIYNRALDPDTRHHAENYLRWKYFNATGPTVTVIR